MAVPDGSSTKQLRPGAASQVQVRQVVLLGTGLAAGLGRRFARDSGCVGPWPLEEAAVLLVSELVGNAVRHVLTDGAALGLRLEADRAWLRIEVIDNDPRPPQPRTPDTDDESGFGFVLIEAMSRKWGVREIPGGKAVWVELRTDVATEPDLA
jgi:hypothetical protein